MKMSHSLKTSLIIGSLAIAPLFSSCEKGDDTKPNPDPENPPTTLKTDTIKGLAYAENSIGFTDELNEASLFSAFYVAKPVKSSEAKAVASINVTINLPIQYSSYATIKASGDMTVTAKEGYNLFTVTDPNNAKYKGVVTSVKFPISTEKTARGNSTYFRVDEDNLTDLTMKTGVSPEEFYKTLSESLSEMINGVNSAQGNASGITIKTVKADGTEVTVTDPKQIDFANDKMFTINGYDLSVSLTKTLFAQNFNTGYAIGPVLTTSDKEFQFGGKKSAYVFITGTAL